MHIINLILVLLLIIIYIFISFKIIKYKEKYINIFGLKIFVLENNEENCSKKNKELWKCGWKIIGTYPENFPDISNLKNYSKPIIINISNGLKGDRGDKGNNGNILSPKKMSIKNINDYDNYNLNINSNKIKINSKNKINLINPSTNLCINNECINKKNLNNLLNYLNKYRKIK